MTVVDPGLTEPLGARHHSRAHGDRRVGGGGPSGQDDHVAALACEVSELLEVLWGRDREVPTTPLSASQLRLLFVLERGNGINLRALADAMGSTPSSVSRLLDRLQAVGYVKRATSVASRRELELYLTQRGRQYLADLRTQRESEVAAVLAAMPARSRTALRDGLAAFRDTAAQRTFPVHGALSQEDTG
jgi:DNA-binding MarR family transcriptional regulator